MEVNSKQGGWGRISMLMKYSNLRKKDLEYMSFILKNGMVTSKQLHLNFGENTMDAVWHRLRKLKDLGLIKMVKVAAGMVVYIGTLEARDLTETNVTVAENPSLYTARHELLVVDLILYHQLIAQKGGRSFDYKTEREFRYELLKEEKGKPVLKTLNQNKDNFPDAVFYVTIEGKPQKFWVELELNRKENKRYDDKFKRQFDQMLKYGDYDQIWYFTDNGKIKKAIETMKKKHISLPDRFRISDIPAVIKKDTWEEVISSESKKIAE